MLRIYRAAFCFVVLGLAVGLLAIPVPAQTLAASKFRFERQVVDRFRLYRDLRRIIDPTEVLMIPCYGKSERGTQSCQSNFSAVAGSWRPYDPAVQNYPYALRQRWVRSFNDAYMVINQKVTDKYGKINEEASAAVFSETTGAPHPSAEGQAAMADGLMLAIRPALYDLLYAGR